MAFYAKLKKQPLAKNRELLERVGILQAAGRRVGTYSKGMRQRLALAQALLGEPKVLLFDEPTTGLDPASRQMFYEVVRELNGKGATVLLSTHALAELDGHADRIVVMRNGVKVADGSMDELHIQSGLPLTVTVRRLTLGEIEFKNAAVALKREVGIALINGLTFACLMGVIASIWFSRPMLGVVIGASMLINLFFAGFFGTLIPLTLKKFNIDPAVGSAVLLTTVTDTVGFFSFLGLAKWILL